ncbi:MAG: hypothetical protein ABW002_04060 [Xanthomonas sp.]
MTTTASVMTMQLRDGADAFSVTRVEAERSSCIGFFAVGRGGSPLRHLPLLQSLANRGCTVIAPHFTLLASAIPTKEELDTRIRRFEIAADGCTRADQPIVGIGHSIGAVTLLVLAGGQARTLAGERVVVGSTWRFARLALLAPPADFFRHPGALDDVDVQTLLRVGAKDTMTPPAHAEFLQERLAQKAPVALALDENAGHFTYMDALPPQVSDPQPDRDAFLSALADAVGRFVTASG